MGLSTARVVFESPLLRIVDVDCRHPRGGCSEERGGEATHLTLLRRGGFGYHLRGRVHQGTPATALLYRAGDSYRISHPCDGGDACTCFELPPAHEEELFGRRADEAIDACRAATTADQFQHQVLLAALRKGALDRLAIEEHAAALCMALMQRDAAPQRALTAAARRQLGRAQACMLQDPAGDVGLDTLARQAGCSPFHLARLFRRACGITFSDYRIRLRLALGLERLAQGADDLAALACSLGFSHHSHFSAAFRRQLGMTPSEARTRLRSPALIRLSRNLTAAPTTRR